MRKKYLIPLCLLSLCLFGCDKSNDVKIPTSKEETVEVSTSTEKLELVGFNTNIKTDEIINPGMGFYRTKYLTLKRETEKPEYDFSYNGFYHVRIDLSDFSIPASAAIVCLETMDSVTPFSRCSRDSPTQIIGVRFNSRAALARLLTVSSVSPKYCLRSLCPMMTCVTPRD